MSTCVYQRLAIHQKQTRHLELQYIWQRMASYQKKEPLLGHIRIFIRGVLGSFDVLLVDQHLDALLDDGDGRGEARL